MTKKKLQSKEQEREARERLKTSPLCLSVKFKPQPNIFQVITKRMQDTEQFILEKNFNDYR